MIIQMNNLFLFLMQGTERIFRYNMFRTLKLKMNKNEILTQNVNVNSDFVNKLILY